MEQFFGILFSAIFGAIFGSYATLFAHRLPLQESCFGRYFGPKSRCPKCENIIPTKELIPILNWFFTLGKCSKCKAKIPLSHLFIEISCTILFVLCYLKFSFSELFLLYAISCAACVVLVVTDFKHRIFPYQILVLLLVLSVASRILVDKNITYMIYGSAISISLSVLFYHLIYKKTSGVFATQNHFFDYIKFILIASIFLQPLDFVLYFLVLLVIFSTMVLFDVTKTKKFGFGFCLIIPFIWLILI